MSTEREQFIRRVKNSLAHTLLPEASPEHPGAFQGYSFQAGVSADELVENFARELEALSGHVHLLPGVEEIIPRVLKILRQHKANQVIAWDDISLEVPGLTEALAAAGIAVVTAELPTEGTERKARLAEMDEVPVGLTGAHGGLADTGAVALISGPGRSRLASLLPPVHIVHLPKSKLYPSLPAFLAANPTATAAGSNLVLIAGPSRTGDIEMTLSMGVHGPGEVHVIIGG